MVYVTHYGLTDIHKRLDDIAKEMKKWTVRGSAIKVMTPSEIRDEDKRADEYFERMRAQSEAETEALEHEPPVEEDSSPTESEDPAAR